MQLPVVRIQDSSQNKDDNTRKPTPIKFILPLELEGHSEANISNSLNETFNGSQENSIDKSLERRTTQQEVNKKRTDELKQNKKDHLTAIAKIKRQMAEIEIQGEELHREVNYFFFPVMI